MQELNAPEMKTVQSKVIVSSDDLYHRGALRISVVRRLYVRVRHIFTAQPPSLRCHPSESARTSVTADRHAGPSDR